MKYRKRPTEVEAVQWSGENAAELEEWCGSRFNVIDEIDKPYLDDPDWTAELLVSANGSWLGIVTGEWIIRDARGFYPCKPDIFEQTYEPVDDAA